MIVILAVFVLAWQLLFASGVEASLQANTEPTEPGSPSATTSARAKSLFRERCSRCHGVDGRGKTTLGEIVEAPDFTDAAWWDETKNEKRFVNSITGGKGQMPSFGKKLSKRDIGALANYVRGFRK